MDARVALLDVGLPSVVPDLLVAALRVRLGQHFAQGVREGLGLALQLVLLAAQLVRDLSSALVNVDLGDLGLLCRDGGLAVRAVGVRLCLCPVAR